MPPSCQSTRRRNSRIAPRSVSTFIPERGNDSFVARISSPVSSSALRNTSSRRSVQASATPFSMSRKPGIPMRDTGGQYVPPKNGLKSGVRNIDIGQPPRPVIICTDVI